MTNKQQNFIKSLNSRIEFYDESIEKLGKSLEKLEKIQTHGTQYSYSDNLAQVKAKSRFDTLMKKTTIGKMKAKIERKDNKTLITLPRVNMKTARSNVDKICQVIDDFILSLRIRYFSKMFAVHEVELFIAYFETMKAQEQKYLDLELASEEREWKGLARMLNFFCSIIYIIYSIRK